MLYILLVVILILVGALVFTRMAPRKEEPKDLFEIQKMLQEMRDSLNNKIDSRLDKTQSSLETQLRTSSDIVKNVTERLTKLDETNRRVVGVADELKTLQNVLTNPKQRGVLGEYQLNNILSNIFPNGLYKLQYKFKNGDIVDAVIKLDKGKLLPIDSKFSLENYNRYIQATDKFEKSTLHKLFISDLKKRIEETSKYIRPEEDTLDHAFMFIPSESIYYDLLNENIGGQGLGASISLLEYAYSKKNVIIAGPTTLLAHLQTVMSGLQSQQIEEQAKEIKNNVAELKKHLDAFEAGMQKLGKSLTTTVGHYNSSYKELGKVDKDFVKLGAGDKTIEPLLIDKPILDEY